MSSSSHSLGLMTVSEAADYLNIPRPTLYQHLREGRIPGIQIGGRWRIESKELRRVVGAEPEPPVQEASRALAQSPPETDSEIRHLTEENQRLREIIAQQLLEIHKMTMGKSDAPDPSSPNSSPAAL